MIELNTHNLAWAAGFYDGEGCCITRTGHNKISNSTNLSICLGVAQVRKEPLERFKNTIGFGNIRLVRNGERKIHRLDYTKFENVQYIICILWPYLSVPKKEQYIKASKEFLRLCVKPSNTSSANKTRRWRSKEDIKLARIINSKKPKDPNSVFINPFNK